MGSLCEANICPIHFHFCCCKDKTKDIQIDLGRQRDIIEQQNNIINMQSNRISKLENELENKTPARSEIGAAYFEDANMRVGIGIKRDYNNKGDLINEEKKNFFQLKNQRDYYLE